MRSIKLYKSISCFCFILLWVFTFNAPAFYRANSASVPEIWSAYSTEKILKDVTYPAGKKGEAKIEISMAKGEYESAQIIVTGTDTISSLTFETSELSNGAGKKIAASSVSVYFQHYIEVEYPSNNTFEPGWWPDGLIPLQNVINKKENKVDAGCNQGLWIKFQTDSSTAPGRYTGTFNVVADGNRYPIPVQVDVWDFDISEYAWPMTCFLMYVENMAMMEGDSGYDMWKTYFDFMLDYGISIFSIPTIGTDYQLWLENVVEYYDEISSYALPYTTGIRNYKSPIVYYNNYLQMSPDFTDLDIMLKSLVIRSVEDGKDYLEKAYIYNLYVDEYTYDESRKKLAQVYAEHFSDLLLKVESYFDVVHGENYLDSVEGLRASLVNVSNLSTSFWVDDVTDRFNAWVPLWSVFGSDQDVENNKQYMTGEYDEQWWYGCIEPIYPYPSYNIDDPLIDERLVSWMQYDYGIVGNLYYHINIYGDLVRYNGVATPFPTDPWTDPTRITSNRANGDGWLIYPGAKYGIKGPVGTVRLEGIRDGMEEYKYFKLLDYLYAGLEQKYGVELNTDALLGGIFDSLYSGTLYDLDTFNFDVQRKSIGTSIESASSDLGLGFISKTETLDHFDVTFVADSSYQITSDQLLGTPQNTGNGQGKIYTLRIPKGSSDSILNFSYTNGSESGQYQCFLAWGQTVALSFAQQSHADKVTVKGGTGSGKGTIQTKDGIQSLKLTLKSYAGVQSVRSPSFEINADVFGNNLANIRMFSLEIYNDGNQDLTIKVFQINENLEFILTTTVLKANSRTRVTVKNLSDISLAKGIRFDLPSGANKTYNVYISNLRYNVG